MRAVIQRVSEARVRIDGEVVGAIGWGLLVLVGVEDADSQEDIDWLSKKIIQLRIFNDAQGAMNRSLLDIEGDLLVVSQFTLHASSKKGNRPSFIKASKPSVAIPLYENFVETLRNQSGRKVETGRFGADMKVELLNDGPVTILLDTKAKDLF